MRTRLFFSIFTGKKSVRLETQRKKLTVFFSDIKGFTELSEELEAEALKLTPEARARLAGKLLESLEGLSEKENQRLWAEEAARRDADLDASPGKARPADDVFRDARSRLG